MRRFLLLGLALALPAYADLYRWIDRETGSVKYSNLPPPWYGDPLREGVSPAVEVLRYQPAGKPPAEAATGGIAQLEERWRSMLQFLSIMPQRADFDRAGQGFRQQIQAFEAVRAELDRQDPAGAARRRAEQASVLERLR
jgi:uncharacterized protein DUF4124